MKAKHGFTLVEILIVVVILGILAAMVIPVFGQVTTEAKTSALASNLQKIRLQIILYKTNHIDLLPGNGTGSSPASFEQSLLGKTDLFGNTIATGRFGPYLERMPINSFNGLNTVRIDGAAPGANSDGWRFNSANGDFRADDSNDHAQL
jgi:general secretion pathway protein G